MNISSVLSIFPACVSAQQALEPAALALTLQTIFKHRSDSQNFWMLTATTDFRVTPGIAANFALGQGMGMSRLQIYKCCFWSHASHQHLLGSQSSKEPCDYRLPNPNFAFPVLISRPAGKTCRMPDDLGSSLQSTFSAFLHSLMFLSPSSEIVVLLLCLIKRWKLLKKAVLNGHTVLLMLPQRSLQTQNWALIPFLSVFTRP